ncbi:MAG: S9 family peptidase, partial [Holophagae bacterium]
MMRRHLAVVFLIGLFAVTVFAADDDPYLWMEEVENEKALAWAKERAETDTAVIEAVPEFEAIKQELVEIYTSSDRIPTPAIRGEWVYNFWL